MIFHLKGPCLTIQEMEKKERMRSQIAKQVLMTKIRPALPTYTLLNTYLHYIEEPSDIPFSTTCLRFTACLR